MPAMTRLEALLAGLEVDREMFETERDNATAEKVGDVIMERRKWK